MEGREDNIALESSVSVSNYQIDVKCSSVKTVLSSQAVQVKIDGGLVTVVGQPVLLKLPVMTSHLIYKPSQLGIFVKYTIMCLGVITKSNCYDSFSVLPLTLYAFILNQ